MKAAMYHRLALLALCLILGSGASARESFEVDIPFESFTLENGLRVIVHPDHKAPVVAVSVWYHVGSKNEPPGKTGFAHLFEHIMFEGSENFDQDISVALDHVGATSVNGTTWYDRTNYFENVPTPALEFALWLESDRMGHLLGALTQDKLDQERGVVQNEKRQRDSQPYGKVNYHILAGLFPPGHPYHHDTIGSMQDLEAASLEDVKIWFTDYYGAANTVLVLAGDVTPERAETLVRKYFSHIPPGPPVARVKSRIPERSRNTREDLYDRVPHVRSLQNWAVPGRTEKDFVLLQLAAQVLGDGKNSRLYQALIYEQQKAVELNVVAQGQEIASMFSIDVTLKPDTSLHEVNDIIEQELRLFFRDGPGEEELKRARAKMNANIIRGLEVVGGFSGKATTLAEGELYDGNPEFYKTRLSWINHATTQEVREAARQWLAHGSHQINVLPIAEYRVSMDPVDRSQGPPVVGKFPDVRFPEIQRARLKNGMPVVFAERSAVPVVSMAIQFDAGYAADFGYSPGTASFTLAMMDESTRTRSALEIDAEAEYLGAEIRTGSNLDMSGLYLSALAENLAPSIDLFADIVRNPAFAADEMERMRSRWLEGIEQEKSQPVQVALRTLPPLVYGDEHAYGIPFTGSGTEASIHALSREDLLTFHSDWLRPDNATLYVVGATTLNSILPMLEDTFGDWEAPRQPPPQKKIAAVSLPDSPRLIVIDKPGAPQSMILAAHLAPPTGVDSNLAITLMNDIVGGEYRARVNRNLRMEKRWSYGAFTLLPDARAQRPWIVYAPVQTDQTAASIKELLGEFERVQSTHPIDSEELQWAVRKQVLSLPAQFETGQAVLGALQANERFDRPDDYVSSLKQAYEAVTLESVQGAAEEVLHPNRLIWVVVGDRKVIESDLQSLGLATPEFLDTDGNPVSD